MKTIKNFILSLFLTKEERQILKKHNEGYLGVYWNIKDLEMQAATLEEFDSVNEGSIYDRSKFPLVLERMISEHDASLGINWDTITIYLNEYCKF